jgi:hypothetical protein
MKSIFILGFLFFGIVGSAQSSLYRNRTNVNPSYVNEESFIVSFEHSLYGIAFKQNDRNLDDELKESIKNFVKNTKVSKFRKIGVIELEIVKRKQIYYVVAQKKPEKILVLMMKQKRYGN